MNTNDGGPAASRDTSCWRCSAYYSAMLPRCPKCNATNANADFEAALAEMNHDRQDAMLAAREAGR